MISFLVSAAALVALALLTLFWPRGAAGASASVLSLNRQLYREQLADPQLDDEGRDELRQRALQDLAGLKAEPLVTNASLGWGRVVALSMFLLTGAAGLYAWWGTPEALDPSMTVAAGDHGRGDMSVMVDRLADKLGQRGGDARQWAMLARSYHVLGRMSEAAKAFEQVGPALQQDAQLLCDYADALGSLAGGHLAGKPAELIQQALQVDPELPMALSLAAAAAWEQGDHRRAQQHWEHLLRILPPESEDARWIQSRIKAMGAEPMATSGSAVATDVSLSGTIELAPALAGAIPANATLFLLARAPSGNRMPLAIQRRLAGDLPLSFRLTEADAMTEQSNLGAHDTVVVEARISLTGNAKPSPGDLYGLSAPVKPGAAGLKLVIDKRI